MSDRRDAHARARAFFDDIWQRGDFWQLETSEFERKKYLRQLELLQGRRHGKVLEIGCGSGCFSRLLAATSDRVVALDVSAFAIERARAVAEGIETIDFRVANVMEYDPTSEGPWDLVVLSETIYYLGWLYPFWDLAWLARQLFVSTAPGGELIMANSRVTAEDEDYLLQPWIIRTYHDLFSNVGYEASAMEVFSGEKEGRPVEALISVFRRPLQRAPP